MPVGATLSRPSSCKLCSGRPAGLPHGNPAGQSGGLLEHATHRRDAGEALLFPEGYANSRGQVAAKLGERFSTFVKGLGFSGRKLGTHSFRHCFEDRLRAAELAERTALALARRAEPGSGRIYGDGLSVRQEAEAVAKIVYPGLDLSHLYQPADAA